MLIDVDSVCCGLDETLAGVGRHADTKSPPTKICWKSSIWCKGICPCKCKEYQFFFFITVLFCREIRLTALGSVCMHGSLGAADVKQMQDQNIFLTSAYSVPCWLRIAHVMFSLHAVLFTYERAGTNAWVKERWCPCSDRVGGSWATLRWPYRKTRGADWEADTSSLVLHKSVSACVAAHTRLILFLCCFPPALSCLPFRTALQPGGQRYPFFFASRAFPSVSSPLAVTFPLSGGGAASIVWLVECFSGKERRRRRKIGCWFLPPGKMCRGDILFLEGGDFYYQGGNFP